MVLAIEDRKGIVRSRKARRILSAFSCITGAVGCVLNALILHYYVSPNGTLVTLTQIGLGFGLFAIFLYLIDLLKTIKVRLLFGTVPM